MVGGYGAGFAPTNGNHDPLQVRGVDLVGARMVWRRASSGGRAGFIFQITGHGGRHVLHVAGWAPGETIDDLLGSILRIDPRLGDPYAIPPDAPGSG